MYVIGEQELKAMGKVLATKQLHRYVNGRKTFTDKFEAALGKRMGAKYTMGVTSGTAGLVSALVGMGVGPGDEVIVPAYTFMASALACTAVGAVPVICEVDESLTMDPADAEQKITRWTKVLMPVHMSGLPCDMGKLKRVAKKHGVAICEDACQGVGGSYRGKMLGTIGQAGVLSFNHYKNITCGEGGAMLMNDKEVYYRALMYHDSGCVMRHKAEEMVCGHFSGVNFRISEIQSAMMRVQLGRMDGIIRRLRARKRVLRELFEGCAGVRCNPVRDEAGDCGNWLMLMFERVEDAEAFSRSSKQGRVINTGLHVYSNWTPILEKRAHHPRMDPWKWAKRKVQYSKGMCGRSLELMERTVMVHVPYEKTIGETRKWGRKLVKCLPT